MLFSPHLYKVQDHIDNFIIKYIKSSILYIFTYAFLLFVVGKRKRQKIKLYHYFIRF